MFDGPSVAALQISDAAVLRHAGSRVGCSVTNSRFERHVMVRDMIRRTDITIEEPPGYLGTVDVVAIVRGCIPIVLGRVSRLVRPCRGEVLSRDRCSTVIGGGRP